VGYRWNGDIVKEVLVFTATYNEADNIASLVEQVLVLLPQCDMLVVDDNSPDGTGRILEELKAKNSRLHVMHRPSKNGSGTAHKLAIKYALAHDYSALITMDADFSHDPKYLPEMIRQLSHAEFVIGSRYAPGGSCEYPPSRVLLSRAANTLTRRLLRIPLRETTTSYRGFRRSLMERMNVDAIHANDYSYFIESIYQVSQLTRGKRQKDQIAEFPIRFVDRRAGTTKISRKEIVNGLATLARLATLGALTTNNVKPKPTGDDRSEDLLPCIACGCTYHVERYPASNAARESEVYSCTSTAHGSHGRIVRCLGCGLVFTNPRLSESDVLSLYSQVEDKTYLENADARLETFSYNFDAIREFLPKTGRLLDLGSYCGFFLKVARDRGYDVMGVEPSTWASSYARDTLGIQTVTGGIGDLPEQTPAFDVICSWDVLEHVSNPVAELASINERLRKGGIFAFSTLDYGNWYPRLMGERWPWMMDMHLYYFDQKVMKEMLESVGFRLLHTRNYRHIITFEYFLRKVGAMGIPGADALRRVVERTPLRTIRIPFYFGDIQLFVCEKM
jgi:2-polyprenyl-3-methyl-5-hydroxy-6-metoxy-1,4-benzoquinol methylase